jgi:CubicO group peptidase (beta-lactamase class C family)
MHSAHKLAARVSLLLAVAACGITDEDLKLPYTGYAPEALGDGWMISTPEAEGLDPERLDDVYGRLFSQEAYPTAHSLLVVRHGRLVAEGYARDPGERGRPHHIQSATKSITSILTGIALDQGLLSSVHTPLYDFIPEAFDDDPAKRGITLFHVLTMQTGLEFDNDVHTVKLFHSTGSSLEYVLHRNLVFTPGTSFYYHDGNPQLVSGVLQAVSGMTEEQLAAQYLFGPLGIEDYRWERHADGLTFGAFGLWLRPRDMAKIGLMLVQGGTFGGERIVSSEWIDEARTPHTPQGDYGYYFWLLPEGVFRAEGHGGQIIHVVQRDDLVVVLTADPYSSTSSLSPGMYGLVDEIVAAVRE